MIQWCSASELKWHQRYLELARHVASWSRDPSTKCGAVIIRPNKTIASVGFNGFPRGVSDAEELYLDREVKYSRVIHAEQNAILNASENLSRFSMYVWPPGHGPTCDRCAAHVIQAGITQVYHFHKFDAAHHARWGLAITRGLIMYGEAGVSVFSIAQETGELV
jgi:dCMP deaminase